MSQIDEYREDVAELCRVIEAARRRPLAPTARRAVPLSPAALGGYLRDYAPGDDYRAIDWRLAARLDELRVTVAPRPVTRTIGFLLDASGSMATGRWPKWSAARRAAALLGALALGGDMASPVGPPRVRLATFADRILYDVPSQADPLRWAREVLRLEMSALRQRGDFACVAEQLARRVGFVDQWWVATDGFDAERLLIGLARLCGGARTVRLLHLVDANDRDPGLVGDVELVDTETGVRRRTTITRRLLARFRESYDAWLARLHRGCRAAGITVCTLPADAGFAALVRCADRWGAG